MKKEVLGIPKLELKNGIYLGGFTSLTSSQLIRIKGGGTNSNCTNEGDCTKGTHTSCTNSGTCIAPGGNL